MNEQAKKIFFDSFGSHCQMDREGVYEKYKQYGISKEQEKLWLSELEEQEIFALNHSSNIKMDYCLLCVTTRKSKNVNLFSFLFDYLMSGNTTHIPPISQLYMINAFVDVMRRMRDIIDMVAYKPDIQNEIFKIQSQFNNDVEVQRQALLLLNLLSEI